MTGVMGIGATLQQKLLQQALKLKALGVRVSNNLLSLLKTSSIDVLYSIESTLDFVEALKPLIDYSEVEPKGDKGDVDVKAVVDGKTIAFQVKLLYTIRSKIMLEIIKSSKEFTERCLNKHGTFIKAVFTPQQSLKFIPKIIEHRRVHANVNVSYASLLYPVDLLTCWAYPRIISRIKKSYPQLKDVDADYRIAVIDVRKEPINEYMLWSTTKSWLVSKGTKYPKLSGVIFMRHDVKTKKDQAGTWLIPVINPHAENPLDPKLLLKNVVLPTPSFGARHLLILPTRIHIPKAGEWIDLIQLEPGFKIVYKDIYFGTII